MHLFSSIIFCLFYQHASSDYIQTPPLWHIVATWAMSLMSPWLDCEVTHVAATSKQLKSHPCC